MSAIATSSDKSISTNSILDWGKSYPRRDYPSTDRSKTYTLHYLIALNQPEESILSYIDTQTQKKIHAKLFSADKEIYLLTPLMLAVMKGRVDVAKKLLQIAKELGRIKEQVNQQDQHGWTPLHHAAIKSGGLFDLLIQHDADRTIQNKSLGTADDLKALTSENVLTAENAFSTTPSAFKTYLVLPNQERVLISKLGKDTLQTALGLKEYRDAPFFPKSEINGLWKTHKNTDFLNHKIYDHWLKNTPELCIRECEELSAITENSKELISLQDIPLGYPVGVYSGVIDTKNKTLIVSSFAATMNSDNRTESYKLSTCYAHESGNALRFANFGFPNISAHKVIAGGAKHNLFLSGGISKGDRLLWNYGSKMPWLTYGKMRLFGREAMRDFFKKGLDFHITSLQNNQIRSPFESVFTLERVAYPLSVPAAILDLHAMGIVHAKDWSSRMRWDKSGLFHEWYKSNNSEANTLMAFLRCIIDLDKAIGNKSLTRVAVNQWILKHNEKLSVMQISRVLENLKVRLGSNPNLAIEPFLTHQESAIENYDWNKDLNAPVSLQGVVSHIAERFSKMSPDRQISMLTGSYKECEARNASEDSDEMIILKSLVKLIGPKGCDEMTFLKLLTLMMNN